MYVALHNVISTHKNGENASYSKLALGSVS